MHAIIPARVYFSRNVPDPERFALYRIESIFHLNSSDDAAMHQQAALDAFHSFATLLIVGSELWMCDLYSVLMGVDMWSAARHVERCVGARTFFPLKHISLERAHDS